jgi:hypothetical protein
MSFVQFINFKSGRVIFFCEALLISKTGKLKVVTLTKTAASYRAPWCLLNIMVREETNNLTFFHL